MNIAIIGANGIVGTTLTEELMKRKDVDKLVLAARSFSNSTEKQVMYQQTDALNKEDIQKLLKRIDIAFLTIGLPYQTSVWEHDWPIIMENVLQACENNKVKLVFFDNVYAYGY